MNLPTSPDITKTLLFNPSKDDFKCLYDSQEIIMPSRVISEYPKYLADHIAKHLASKLALDEDTKTHFEDRISYWKEKIYIQLES